MENSENVKTDLIVSTLEDENDGDFSAEDLSLREAIANSNDGDTITFDSSLSGGTINLISGELTIDKSLTIQGLGANNLTIDEQSVQAELPDSVFNRIFKIDDGDENTTANVTITGVTITGGNPDATASGGGILNRENLTLNSSVVDDNFTEDASGGGIRNEGELTLNNSVVSNNSAGFRNLAGGIFNSGTANIINSTVTRNSSFAPGGGIASSGTLNISNSTITNNAGNFNGDGVNVIDGLATVTSSIIAGNGDSDLQGSFISNGNNLIGNISGATGFTNGINNDIVGSAELPIEPRLDKLQNNGGSTPTVALLNTSPAIDAGSNPNDLTTDQRGEGFARTVGDGTDIGAFELLDNNGGGQTLDPSLDGDDVINGDNADNVLLGGEGNNVLYGFKGSDRLETGSGKDTLDGNQGNDTLIGGDGDNILNGFDGDDVLETGSGKDNLNAGNGDDTITAGGGNDVITGGSGWDTIDAGSGDDTIDGGADNDVIDAGDGDDRLEGNIGNDTLTGGADKDTLIGGGGDDLLTGNGGNDVFVLDLQGGANTIQDFDLTQDTIGLSDDIIFNELTINGSDESLITYQGQNIGIIANISATSLSAENFSEI